MGVLLSFCNRPVNIEELVPLSQNKKVSDLAGKSERNLTTKAETHSSIDNNAILNQKDDVDDLFNDIDSFDDLFDESQLKEYDSLLKALENHNIENE